MNYHFKRITILNMAAKYCICATTLNTSGILIVNNYPNIETHTQPRKHTYITDTHKHVLKTVGDWHNF